MSLHEETRGYAPLAFALAVQGSSNCATTSWIATRHGDLLNLKNATAEQNQQLRQKSIVVQDMHQPNASKDYHEFGKMNIVPGVELFVASRPEVRQKSNEYRMVVVGADGADKSSVCLRFQISAAEGYDTILPADQPRSLLVDGGKVLVDVFDSTTKHGFSFMRKQYMKVGDGFLLLYSLTSRESFFEISVLRRQIDVAKDAQRWPRVLVANHYDRENDRVVSQEEGQHLAVKLGCTYIEEQSTMPLRRLSLP